MEISQEWRSFGFSQTFVKNKISLIDPAQS